MATEYKAFSDFALNKQLLTAVEEQGYTMPTEIQQRAIPPILAGNHIMGIAQTGTGKTAAYLLPILMKLKYPQGDDVRCVIIVPTRELVLQVSQSIEKLAVHTGLRHVALYGGIGPKAQTEQVEKGCDIIVATPGRFMDVYKTGKMVVKKIQVLVLDEADRLMDMGFVRQIHTILEVIRQKKQCLLFSATMSPLVRKIAGDFLEFPIEIEITPQQKTAVTVSQELYYTPNLKTKINLLERLFADPELRKAIVFCRSRVIAESVGQFLQRKLGKDRVKIIHANKGQNMRLNAIEDFKQEGIIALVATDVAARGLDVLTVSHVINVDVPLVYEDYVHRIGRTGRAFQSGHSVTFASPAEEYHIEKIEVLIGQKIPVTETPEELIDERTPFDERQKMNRELDNQRRKEDPTFKGAFHEKKKKRKPAKDKKKGGSKLSKASDKKLSRKK